MEWSQANRPFRLNTPLGRDVMLLASWEGEEAISSLFRFTVVAWSRRHDIQPKELLLKGVSLDLRLPSGADRKLHGVVSRFVRGEIVAEGHMSYLLEIVPPHWMLTLGSSFDIFQNKTARDVCDELLTGTPMNGNSYAPSIRAPIVFDTAKVDGPVSLAWLSRRASGIASTIRPGKPNWSSAITRPRHRKPGAWMP